MSELWKSKEINETIDKNPSASPQDGQVRENKSSVATWTQSYKTMHILWESAKGINDIRAAVYKPPFLSAIIVLPTSRNKEIS